jgi:ATP-dependent RNA helicase SUPV3L1/SUV3
VLIEGRCPPVTHPQPPTVRRRERSALRPSTERGTGRAAAREERRAQQNWVEGAAPTLPVRTVRPDEVVFHLGPTNSGKTYDSLQALAATGSGVYAAPLRQLAHEAYAKLSTQLPPGTVGLSTGEEEIDPHAPIVCCTVEKAPARGELLVLDESHWIADPDRGHHWARLLLTGEYRVMHLISAAEAHPLLEPLVADARHVTVVDHERLSRLDVLRAPVRADGVRPQTLVVAFSRKAVYAVAAELDQHRPGKVGVLYGALPPATRREVIERFTDGELEVLVTTDVIGHGINVPATTVLFAETTKFDGTERRPLRSWETAQIAGRAGRYGLTGHGRVGILVGVAGLRPAQGLLVTGAEVARGDAVSDLPAAGAPAAAGAGGPRRVRGGRPARGADPVDGVGAGRHPGRGDDPRRRRHAGHAGAGAAAPAARPAGCRRRPGDRLAPGGPGHRLRPAAPHPLAGAGPCRAAARRRPAGAAGDGAPGRAARRHRRGVRAGRCGRP